MCRRGGYTMNARELITFVLRALAIFIFIQMLATLRLYDRSSDYQPIYFAFIIPGVISCLLMALSGTIARALAPDDELGVDEYEIYSAFELQPLAFAVTGLVLVIRALSNIPAMLTFVFSQSHLSYGMPDSVRHQFWLERSQPYLLLLVGIILIARARQLSSWWHTYTFGRFEE